MDDLLSAQMQTALARASGSGETPRTPRVDTPEQARKVAEEFEAMLLSQLMEHMMGETTKSEAFGGGPGEAAFTSMLNEEYGKVMARAGGIGLADDLAREIMTLQEGGESQ